MDCPWCGCGWLFTCIECRKAFTFARGVIVDESWEETAEHDLRNRFGAGQPVAAGDVALWVDAMKAMLADVEVDQTYVYLDGLFIPTRVSRIEVQGWHSHHKLPHVPQVAAMQDHAVLSNVLGNHAYWKRTASPGEPR